MAMSAKKSPYERRNAIYKKVEAARDSRVISYVTGDRPNMETQISPEVIDIFTDHLDALFPTKRITLLLHTRGGNTLAAWSLINLVRMFCDELEIIVPVKAHSAGTLMCLGADRIVMTKQATLGPIDPSIQSPLAPQIPGAPPQARAPVSVEAVKGYLSLAQTDLGLKDESALATILVDLAQKVHPLLLGDIFRSRSQIQHLARQLLKYQVKDKSKQSEIIKFLCSDSGSHDYTINRREADTLGLRVEKANPELYVLVKQFHETVREELMLGVPYTPLSMVAPNQQTSYSLIRCFIESLRAGSHIFVSEGTISRQTIEVQPGMSQDALRDDRSFEGWRPR